MPENLRRPVGLWMGARLFEGPVQASRLARRPPPHGVRLIIVKIGRGLQRAESQTLRFQNL